jgi:peptidoglycan pentaglycine glycine transferase (the first glycine)
METMITVRTCEMQPTWDDYILQNDGHPLQLWAWGEVKAAHNWRVSRVFIYQDEQVIGAAQLLVRPLPRPFNALVYVPRGPVAADASRADVLQAIADHARVTYRAVTATIEPDWEGELNVAGWHQSTNTILIPRTLILDLAKSEDELLAVMVKKTRQYIRKSGNEAIEIRQVANREELDACLAIYKQTSQRAGFAVHDDQYYYDVFDYYGDLSPVYAAFKDGQPVAFLWLAISRTVAFELYGGMNDEGQQLRANYALKWRVIRAMKERGIIRYDFNGLLNDGVSTFKQGFADHENMLVGTYDKPLSPFYSLWTYGLPLAKKIVRTIKSLR